MLPRSACAPIQPSAFGAPAASSGGFSFGGGSAPAFGAPAASSGGFSFGGGSAAPGFGAASPGSSLFGSAAPAFGAAPAPSSSPFGSLFGAPGSSTALAPAASTPSLFGAPAAASSIFGAAPAQAAAPAAAAQFAPAALAGSAAGGAGGVAGADAARELQEIANCYTPGHGSYKFGHLFLSVVRPEQRVRPAGVDELTWKQAMKEAGGEANADGWVPVGEGGARGGAGREGAARTAQGCVGGLLPAWGQAR
jgi:hypothetical protein